MQFHVLLLIIWGFFGLHFLVTMSFISDEFLRLCDSCVLEGELFMADFICRTEDSSLLVW